MDASRTLPSGPWSCSPGVARRAGRGHQPCGFLAPLPPPAPWGERPPSGRQTALPRGRGRRSGRGPGAPFSVYDRRPSAGAGRRRLDTAPACGPRARSPPRVLERRQSTRRRALERRGGERRGGDSARVRRAASGRCGAGTRGDRAGRAQLPGFRPKAPALTLAQAWAGGARGRPCVCGMRRVQAPSFTVAPHSAPTPGPARTSCSRQASPSLARCGAGSASRHLARPGALLRRGGMPSTTGSAPPSAPMNGPTLHRPQDGLPDRGVQERVPVPEQTPSRRGQPAVSGQVSRPTATTTSAPDGSMRSALYPRRCAGRARSPGVPRTGVAEPVQAVRERPRGLERPGA